MKLSWHEKWAKRCIVKRNKRILSNILKRSTADSFAGNPKVTRTERMTFIKFKHVNVGISSNDNLDNLLTWEHEFVEHVVGRLILEILVEDGFTIKRMKNIIRDGIVLRGADGNLYGPTVKHIMAALCTFSSIGGNINTSPDEFAEFFGFENGPVAQLESAAPFDPSRKTGVRCRFEFGRGLLESFYCLTCENDYFKYGLADWDEKEFKDEKTK